VLHRRQQRPHQGGTATLRAGNVMLKSGAVNKTHAIVRAMALKLI
jgi:hypothetical protein